MAAFGRLLPFLGERKRRRRARRKLRRVVVQGHVYYVRPPAPGRCSSCGQRKHPRHRG